MKEISVNELNMNPLTAFGDDWMLLTAGNEATGANTMTIGWGHIGSLFSRPGAKHMMPSVVVYVRPQRYTKEFMDRENCFTLSILEPEMKKALGYLGSKSGRDEDKITNAGLTVAYADGMPYLAEAKQVFLCKKVYQTTMKESDFVDKSIVENCYPDGDFHEMYIGEIVKILEK